MGLVYTQQPDGGQLIPGEGNNFVSVQNPSYDPGTMKDYKFILQAYIGEVDSVNLPVATLHANVYPGSTNGVFNLNILKDFVSSSFPFSNNLIEEYPEQCKEFQLQLTDHYNENGAWVETSGSPVVSNSFFVCDAAQWHGDNYYQYKLDNMFSKFLNNRKEFTTSETFPDIFLYYFNINEAAFLFEINVYNAVGSLIGTDVVINPYYENETVQRINVGYTLLEYLELTDNAAYYTIHALNEEEFTSSEEITVKVDRNCYPQEKVVLFYRTHTGAVNSFPFNLKRKETQQEKASYKNPQGKLTGGQYIVNENVGSNVQYYTRIMDSRVLIAPWLSLVDVMEAEDLVNSSEVYMVDSKGNIFPGAIEVNNYGDITDVNNKQRNLEVTFRFSNNKFMPGK